MVFVMTLTIKMRKYQKEIGEKINKTRIYKNPEAKNPGVFF